MADRDDPLEELARRIAEERRRKASPGAPPGAAPADLGASREHCGATRRDGRRCTAPPIPGTDRCMGHRPGADEARRKGGEARSNANRADKRLPARLRWLADALVKAFKDVREGHMDYRVGRTLAAIGATLVRTVTEGETEDRLRAIEAKIEGAERHAHARRLRH